jgi:hypothetical protein
MEMPAENIEKPINVSEKISEGVYRDVYRYNDYAVKKLKPVVTRKILLVRVRVPSSLYTLLRYAIRDLNEYEYKQYQSIISKTPARLHKCFAKVYEPIKDGKISYSINQLVMDDDERVSKSLAEYGGIDDEQFWNRLDDLEKLFLDKKIYYLGIGPHNVCVNRQADGHLLPVLVDYKRIGVRTFWHQLLLYIPYFIRLKMRRRFQRMRQHFRAGRVPVTSRNGLTTPQGKPQEDGKAFH